MFLNYLVTALRSLRRNWLYAAISIFGLAASFAGAILVAQFIRNEFSYDRWIPEYAQVYKIHFGVEQPGQPKATGDQTQITIKKQLAEADPNTVVATARLMHWFPILHLNPDPGGERITEQAFAFADPEIFEILPLPAVAGDPKTALQQPDTVVITQNIARKYFGRENVMGETLDVQMAADRHPMKITAILRDLPSNTNLVTEVFASARSRWAPLAAMDRGPPMRMLVNVDTFAKIAATATPEDLQRALDVAGKPESEAFSGVDIKASFWAVPISELHMTPPGRTGPVSKPAGSKTTVFAISLVGGLIVLVAGLNFVMLMTARASRRAMEVGVRKANGAKRADLIVQFMGETLIYAILSMAVAIVVAAALAQPFSDFVLRDIKIDLIGDPMLGGGLLVATLVIGFLGGVYPALVLSSFRPGVALKSGKIKGAGSPITRQTLVVVQFAILIGLIISTVTIYRQMQFALGQGLGKESELIVQVQTDCRNAFPAEVRKLPGVERAACSSFEALSSPTDRDIVNIDTKDGPQLAFTRAPVDFEFFETFGIEPLAGRVFDRGRGGDGPLPLQAAQQVSTSPEQPAQPASPSPPASAPGAASPSSQVGPRPVILNESATRSLGFATPIEAIGQTVRWTQPGAGPAPLPSEIIGVIPDIPVNVGAKADAALYFVAPRSVSMLSIKATGENLSGTVADIRRVWGETGNVRPIRLTFYADTRRVQYLDIIIQSTLIAICAGAAVAIASLGLFALSAFAAERRTKEIGIRKALGATTSNVLALMMWQFTIPVIGAIVVALPVSYLLMANWLQGFAYRVDLAPWTFALAGLAVLVIAWLTVSFQTFIVARAKSATALRYE